MLKMANEVSKIAFDLNVILSHFNQTCCSLFFPLEYILSRLKCDKIL